MDDKQKKIVSLVVVAIVLIIGFVSRDYSQSIFMINQQTQNIERLTSTFGTTGSATNNTTGSATNTVEATQTDGTADERAQEGEITYQIEDMSATMYAQQECNVRSAPATTFDKIGTLSKNETVTITGLLDIGWYRIEYMEQVGYVPTILLGKH